ncbi:hypothetical protein ACN6MY_03865 [Peribacillus sp. B-H-3]|uniref:hypothetical protein n=1 Tax=Peribacillus sp. B-H-3 TaxID=3400420 RepID=UPI003B01B066
MNVYQVIIAAINAYLEREKARQDEPRTMEIIRAINATVLGNRQIIEDALRDWEIDRLTGILDKSKILMNMNQLTITKIY